MATEKGQKEMVKKYCEYRCEICSFITVNRSKYERHKLTEKHKKNINVANFNKKSQEMSLLLCCEKCNKKYKSRVGLWRHSKTCNQEKENIFITKENVPNENSFQNTINADMFMELIKQNKELQNLLAQQSRDNSELINKLIEREPVNNTINGNVTTNNNNQKFNLNFFLNETCKDAMSIQEFLENIRITFEDLLTIGNSGFVTGVSDILIKQLRDMEVNKRPIHCTDSKRDTIYLKENASWNKDDKDKTRLKQIIEKIEYKNVVALRDWCNENPDARVNNTPNNLLKDKIYFQTLQGDERTRDKIIKNVSKEVMVEKD